MFSRRSFIGTAAAASALASAQSKPEAGKAAPQGGFRLRAHPLEGVAREDLKITDIKVTLMSYELPKDEQWVVGTAVTWKTDAVLVEVLTDKRIVGIGESTPYSGPPQLKKTIEETIKPVLVGKNPFDVEHLTSAWTTARTGASAWAGIDAALWDIIGKAKNAPVYKLLATDAAPQPHIRMYASGGVSYAWYGRPEDLIDEAVRHKEAGYTAFKFRIGTEWRNSGMTIQKYIPYLRRLREAVGPNFDLMQEGNMRWSLEQCLEICPVLEELKFLWFEEPVSTGGQGAIDAYLKIRQALPTVKVSGGESRTTRFDFKEWIDRDAYDIVQPDCNVTGLTEAWHIAKIAALRGKPCCPHNWHGGLTTMANAALVAGIPNHLMLELNQTYNPFKEEIFKDPLLIKKGYMDLFNRLSRRAAMKSALATLAGTAGISETAVAQQKAGETRVLFLVGDYYHNPAMQEYAWRKVLGATGWRLMFAQAPSFITPEIMAAADLYVLGRYATSTQPTNISLGWSPDRIVERRPEPDVFMTPEHEAMLVRNVRRGMGLVAMHCAVWNPDSRQYLDLLGVEKPVMHGPVVGTRILELNPEHPITKGIQPFNIGIDEAFDAVMRPGQHTQLFQSQQEEPKRNAISGWCRQEGSGRVVALLPGHTTGPYGSRQFLDLMWRSAHWALKRDIPPVPAEVFTAKS